MATLSAIFGPPTSPSSKHQLELPTPAGRIVQVFVREAVEEDEVQWVKERGEGLWCVEIRKDTSAPPELFGVDVGARFIL